MKKIAVILSGCGYKDGTEITEAVSTFIALGEQGAGYSCFAPNDNFESTDHRDGETSGERNIMSESARICRGQIEEISQLNPDDFDGLIFPGGFGAALHLSNWASKGAQCKILPDVVRIISAFHQQSKPIGAICIAPVLISKVLSAQEVTLTVGQNTETAIEIEKTGSVHEICQVDDYITDRANKVISTPAYMYDSAPANQVFLGVRGLVKELVEMA